MSVDPDAIRGLSGALPPDGKAMATRGEVTRLLDEWVRGEEEAPERLIPIVYDELQRIARLRLAGEGVGHTLSTTDLVHEAYLKLVDLERIDWQGRTHFFSMAARFMRRILVDHAVRRKAEKRGGRRQRVPLEEGLLLTEAHVDGILALDEALDRLREADDRSCRVVECRVFAGMTVEETAVALDISPATVKRDWTMARAWLNRELAV